MKSFLLWFCLLYTSDAADEEDSVDLGGRRIIKKKGDLLFIDINANAFLLNMVRIIIGTLLETGLKKKSPKRVNEILEAKDRTLAGKTASPNGLYFVSTEYLKKYKVPNISNSVI